MNEASMEEQEVEQTAEEAAEPAEGSEDVQESTEEAAGAGTRLVLKRSGQETAFVFEFSPPATIGRFDPSVGPVDVDLGSIEESSFVSRKHARIVDEEGTFKIQDLGSSNGTYVLRDDFERVEEAEIKDGDEIAFGNARFVFRT